MSHVKELEHLKVPLDDIKSATNNFGAENLIGRGGFGDVYKGILQQFSTFVAIKRLDRKNGQGRREFLMEITMLCRYKHRNLVALLGFCDECHEQIIVYEFAFHGSLDRYIKDTRVGWLQRLRISAGAARGLEYLHDPAGTLQRVLHRDIKCSNILLDQNFEAKISDFGLSKMGPANQPFTFVISSAVGTVGYCDPVYAETGVLTKESDIYSFGVVLCEILCGRFCFGDYNDESIGLTQLFNDSYQGNKVDEIIECGIRKQIQPKSLEVFSSIVYRCLKRDRAERPTIVEVVKELEIAIEQQQPQMLSIPLPVVQTTISLQIIGYHNCDGCRKKVKDALSKLDGVKLESMELERGVFRVSSTNPPEVIRFALEQRFKKKKVVISGEEDQTVSTSNSDRIVSKS